MAWRSPWTDLRSMTSRRRGSARGASRPSSSIATHTTRRCRDGASARPLMDTAEHARVADPVTIEIVKGALRAAQAETEALLARTAMSDVIREKKDFFTGYYDAEGRIVSGTPIPLLAHVIGPILREYPAETMRPGDLYWYNDCYASDGGVS